MRAETFDLEGIGWRSAAGRGGSRRTPQEVTPVEHDLLRAAKERPGLGRSGPIWHINAFRTAAERAFSRRSSHVRFQELV
jgi:hypothetical protein